MIARFEVRLQKNPFPYPKKYPPPKKKKEYCKGFFWRAYRRNGVEAGEGAYRVTTQAERTEKFQTTTRSARAKSVA